MTRMAQDEHQPLPPPQHDEERDNDDGVTTGGL